VTGSEVVHTDLVYMCEQCGAEFEKLAGSTVLITGGAGFLGYYLIQAPLFWNRAFCSGSPITIVCSDIFLRGRPPWLDDLAGEKNFRVLKQDIGREFPADVQSDFVIHAASIASPTYYRQYPIETMDANVLGLRNVLDHAVERFEKRQPLKGILFFSSSEVYGDPLPDMIPTDESYRGNVSTISPRSCYDEAKRFGEALCAAFYRAHSLPVTIARPFNNYGPGMALDDRRVLADFMTNVLGETDIVILSDGRPTRTFCYVADAVMGYYKVLINGRPCEPYNIGADAPEISMLDLAQLVAEVGREHCGYQGKVIHSKSEDADYLVDNPQRRCPSLAKARAELGYVPRIGLKEGILRTLLWNKDQRNLKR
jgi:UDP-glucuronate decarboxylase